MIASVLTVICASSLSTIFPITMTAADNMMSENMTAADNE